MAVRRVQKKYVKGLWNKLRFLSVFSDASFPVRRLSHSDANQGYGRTIGICPSEITTLSARDEQKLDK